jgi:hypothetical protein
MLPLVLTRTCRQFSLLVKTAQRPFLQPWAQRFSQYQMITRLICSRHLCGRRRGALLL